jgi:hypothetical protein
VWAVGSRCCEFRPSIGPLLSSFLTPTVLQQHTDSTKMPYHPASCGQQLLLNRSSLLRACASRRAWLPRLYCRELMSGRHLLNASQSSALVNK